jgi:pimeloyl-ACP methyl ester carboxylesterase
VILPLTLLLAFIPQQDGSSRERKGPVRPAPRDSSQFAESVVDEAGERVVETADGDLVSGMSSSGGTTVQFSLVTVGSPSSSVSTNGTPAAGTPTERYYEVSISPVPGTNGKEDFLFQEVVSSTPRPLLVVFHKFGTNHYDAVLHTSYFEEARRRGWYCLSAFGGMQSHFANAKFQYHTDAALQWATSHFAIDPERIYGVGFSMGGGAALNYAARHLDPDQAMFAAVYGISPIASITDTYVADPQIQPHFDKANLFGDGTAGSANPFRMQAASVVSFNGAGVVDPTSNLARNLMHVRTRCAVGTGDIPYLIVQNTILRDHFLALGAGPYFHMLDTYNTPPMYHSWDLVSEKLVCDWLSSKRLSMPSSGSTIADRNARYFYFDVVQDAAGAFTPFDWNVDTNSNAVTVLATSNLNRVTIDSVRAGLSSAQALDVTTQAADGVADEVRVNAWTLAPSVVLRDGIASSSWSYDPASDTVSLLESDPASHTWTLIP